MEPWVSKDEAISSKVGNIESFCDFLIFLEYEEVEVVRNASGLIVSAINVSESDGLFQFLCS
jgi:hypothetical protein